MPLAPIVRTPSRHAAAAAAVATLSLLAPAHADLLLYEGFDYSPGALLGNNGGTWDPTAAWSTTGDGGGISSAQVLAGSLSLSDYPTAGGRAEVASNANTGGGYPSWTATRTLPASTSIPVGGDVWVSFLFLQDQSASFANQTWLSFGGDLLRQQTVTRFAGDGPDNIRVGADNGEGPESAAIIAQGTTYLAVSRFSNLNQPVFSGAVNTATMWVFDAAGWDALSAGTLDESALNSLAIGVATHSVGPSDFPVQLGPGNAIDLTVITDFGINNRAVFDEIRVGTALQSVVVPEPASLAVALLGGAALLGRRRG